MKILALAFVGLAQASDAPWHNCTKCTWSPEQITDPMRCIAATGACSAYACSEETLPDGNVSGEHANIHSDLAARPRMLSHSSTHPPPPRRRPPRSSPFFSLRSRVEHFHRRAYHCLCLSARRASSLTCAHARPPTATDLSMTAAPRAAAWAALNCAPTPRSRWWPPRPPPPLCSARPPRRYVISVLRTARYLTHHLSSFVRLTLAARRLPPAPGEVRCRVHSHGHHELHELLLQHFQYHHAPVHHVHQRLPVRNQLQRRHE